MSEQTKIFAGSGKVISTQYGQMTKLSFSRSDLQKLLEYCDSDGNGWVNLDLKEKKDKIEGKPTHYCEVNQYKGSGTAQTPKAMNQAPDNTFSTSDSSGDTLPF